MVVLKCATELGLPSCPAEMRQADPRAATELMEGEISSAEGKG